ncbi:MAG: trimeric intracellular cation channel family protein [Candidatus Spyradosoma sp.]
MFTRRSIFVIISLIAGAVMLRKLAENLDTLLPALYASFASDTLVLPLWIDYAAVFVFGITGTMTARMKGYDFVGAFVLAGITAMGGALVRDGLCIQAPAISPLFSDSGYIMSLTAAWIFGMYLGEYFMRFDHFIVVCDAAGLGLYAVFGTNKALANELSVPVAIGIGMINAVGGGLLRDIIARDEPMVFKPGQFYTAIAVLGSILFVVLCRALPPTTAALIVVIFCVVARIASIRYDLHSRSVAETQERVKRLLRAIREAHRADAFTKEREAERAAEEAEKTAEFGDDAAVYEDDPEPLPDPDDGNAVDRNEKL